MPRLAQQDGPDGGRPLDRRQPGRSRRVSKFHRSRPASGTLAGAWPTLGATVARLQGAVDPGVPPYVSLCYPCTHRPYNEPGPGFLGVAHTPFRPLGDGRDDLVLHGITHDRLHDRRELLASVDRFRREADGRGMMHGHRRLHRASDGRAHVVAAGRGAGSVARRSAHRRALWHGRPHGFDRRQRRTARAAKLSGRAATGRSGRPRGDGQLQQVGLARASLRLVLRSMPRRPGSLRSRVLGAAGRPARPRAGERRHRGGVGRIRPHARRSTPTSAATIGRAWRSGCWPAVDCATGK